MSPAVPPTPPGAHHPSRHERIPRGSLPVRPKQAPKRRASARPTLNLSITRTLRVGGRNRCLPTSSAPLLGQGAMKEKSLYKRINAFFGARASDPARLKKFKGNLVDQICQASGGPCKYKGKDMKAAHMGMGVSGADFTALVEDLVGALDKFKVGAHEKDQLLGALGPMKADIVEKK